MEAAVYQKSPLAEYLEGDGEAEQGWHLADKSSNPQTPSHPSFAPNGAPRPMFAPIESLLTKAKRRHHRSSSLDTMRNVCTVVTSARDTLYGDDAFLDQFRYSIIASQLLTHDANPQPASRIHRTAEPGTSENRMPSHPSYSLRGITMTLLLAFFIAWLPCLMKASSSASWWSLLAWLFTLTASTLAIYAYATKKASQNVCRESADALSDLIARFHALDSVIRSALTFIQEVEVVAKGYDVSSPLAPASRLESSGSERHCHALRSQLATTFSTLINRYLEGHTTLSTLVDATSMQKYHDVYELSREDYHTIIQGTALSVDEDRESLRSLRTSMTYLFTARQIFLCDLLALPSESPIPDTERWSVILEELVSIARLLQSSNTALAQLLDNTREADATTYTEQERSDQPATGSPRMLSPATVNQKQVNSQCRRLDSLSQSVRGLNAKLLLMRDEATAITHEVGDHSKTSSLLAQQNRSVMTELKNLVEDWERGTKATFFNQRKSVRLSQSRSPSGPRSPQSPAHSLGGITAVNEAGSPSAALSRLTGCGTSAGSSSSDEAGTAATPVIGASSSATSEDEVFEAISSPVKSKRLSMTREEKLVKMQEDRRKRATLQESRDTTTSMLRELETVIKHRPRGHTTTTGASPIT